jgi:sec-independent protein translocase protein TatC
MRTLWNRSARRPDEMPFLDHLDELRARIIRSVIALVIAVGLAFWLADRYDLLGFLIAPIEPLLGDTKLKYLSPTDPFFITMKLALYGGLLVAAPIIIYQLWSFVSPALMPRERKAIIPSFYLGLILFAIGVAFAYYIALPMTLKFTMNFQSARLEQSITIDAYLEIVLRLLLAFGLVFEVPVVMLILAAVGIVNYKQLAAKRRYAIVLATIAAALLTPGDVIVVTVGLMIPLIGLYEFGIALARLVEGRRTRARAAEEAAEALEAEAEAAGAPVAVEARGR